MMLDALAEHFPREATWTRPAGRPVHLGDAARLHRHDRPAGARAARERRVRARAAAAYLDGRGGSSMRLNFSGVGEDDIREGVRRIGKVVREQVALYGTLTGAEPAPRAAAPAAAPRRRAGVARRAAAAPAARAMSRVAVLKGGRSLERQVSLRSGARVEDALERLGHEVVRDRRRRPTSSTGCAAARPDVAFVALHGRGGEDGTVQELLELARRARTPASGPGGVHPLHGQGASPSTRCATPASRRPTSTRSAQTAFEELGAAKALPAIEERLDFPIVVKPAGQGSALGIKFARTAADVPGALVAAFSYDTKVLLERHVAGPRPRRLGARGPGRPRGAARSSRRSRARRTSTTSRRATRSAAPTSSARPSCRRRSTRARAGAGARRLPAARAATASPAST